MLYFPQGDMTVIEKVWKLNPATSSLEGLYN